MAFSSFLRRLWIARLSSLALPAGPRTKVSRKLLLEQLEERTVLSPYVVTTTADSGAGSLRDAITSINNDTAGNQFLGSHGVDEIDFAIPTTDLGYNGTTRTFTITPSYLGLPTVTKSVILDATTQPTYSTNPLIVLNGVNVPGGSTGLTIAGGNSVVKGFDIGGFAGGGLALTTNGGDLVEGNYIGTDATGTSAVPNGSASGFGVLVTSSNNIIGGTSAAARNVISGNNVGVDRGLFIYYSDSNYVQGNFIGVDATGNTALGNDTGIDVPGGQFNVIGVDGTNNPAAGNVISGNLDYGVGIEGGVDQGGDNVFAGNLVGLGADGTTVVANTYSGVIIDGGSSGNTIGGTTAAARNVISGNGQSGIEIGNGDRTAGNVIEGNYIGTDATGLLARPNGPAVSGSQASGVWFLGAGANTLGGTAPGAGNVISANGTGVYLDGTTGVQIEGNYIGVNAAGTGALGNLDYGVLIGGYPGYSNSVNNTVGGTAPGAGNVIAFNGGAGVDVLAGYGNSIRGNSIHDNGFLGINGPRASLVLSQATSGSITEVVGTLFSQANTAFALDFYANPSSSGQGQRFLGSATVTTTTIGNGDYGASFDFIANVSLPGQWITATATDEAGNTSDFSQSILIANLPSPVLTGATGGSTTEVRGTLDSLSNTAYTLNFYAGPSSSGAGQRFLGSSTVTTDANGHAIFDVSVNASQPGEWITATATEEPVGNTSQSSQSLLISNVVPPSIVLSGNYTTTYVENLPLDSEAQITDFNLADLQSSPAYSWTVTKNGLPFASGAGAETGSGTDYDSGSGYVSNDFSFTPDAAGTYVVSLTFTDTNGTATASQTIDLTVPPPNQLTNFNYVVGPHYLTPVGSTLYFVADEGNGPQLWRTDGRQGDTALVESGSQLVDPGDISSQNVAQVGSWLYFFSDNSDGTYTLWRNNSAVNPTGSTSPSQLIQNLDFDPIPENEGGGPYQLTAVGHDLYFGSYSSAASAYLLWKVTGADGANPVTAPFPVSGSDAQGPYTLKAAGSNLYFSADYIQNGTTNFVLWGSDGTPGGTAPISDGNGGYVPGTYSISSDQAAVGTDLYDINGGILWQISDPGAPAVAIASVGNYLPFATGQVYTGYDMTAVGGALYFFTADPASQNSQYDLWKCQGTTAAPFWESPFLGDYAPLEVVGVGSDVYFTDADGTDPAHLWKSDGTSGGTEVIQSFELPVTSKDTDAVPFALTPVGSTLYFEGADGRLWQSGGTPQTTHVADAGVSLENWVRSSVYGRNDLSYNFAEISPFAAVGSSLYYSPGIPDDYNNTELWRLNNPPEANSDAYTAGQDTTLTVGAASGVLANDTDPNTPAGNLTASLVSGPSNGSLTLNADGSFTYTPTAGYIGPDSFTYQASDGIDLSNVATVSLTIENLFTQGGLQDALDSQPPVDPTTGNPTVVMQGNTQAQADAFVSLFQALGTPGFTPLQPPAGATTPIDIVITLDSSAQFNEAALVIPQGIRVQINGGTWYGGSPALTFSSGDLTITGATFLNSTDAPTILVTGGHLTLRNDIIQESTGFNDAAIAVNGGTVDLGTASDPGNDTIAVNGAGTFFLNTTANPIMATGDTFELSVITNRSLMLVGNSLPQMSGFVNGIPFTGSIPVNAVSGDQFTLALSTTATSASGVGQYDILATLAGGGANTYIINPATSTIGTMYVVSVGADPTSTTGAQTVTFWDNKGDAKLITAADLSSLDALNLVTQGGSAFDPKSVQQLQSWLSISPNATSAYQLAVQLAAMDLNVLAGNVKATDLLFAGQLLPYASADAITVLSSGGFIDVQDLMNAANAALSQVTPGNPAGDPNQAYEAALMQVLQAANGNSDFVQQEALWNLFGL